MTSSEWRETKLGDLVEIKGGKRLPKGTTLTISKTNHPYIRVRDMNGGKVLDLTKDFEYIEPETQEFIKRYTVDSEDIIISIVGTIGLVSVVGKNLDNANLTENCVKLVNLNDVDTDFLYYFLTSENGQNEMIKGTVGSTQPKLPIYNIKKIELSLPPLQEQKAIAHILSSLDKKIEVNNKINKTLEEMAQTLFKHWFVDFEFPNEDGEPYKSSGGEMIDSELGPIPMGWEVVKLGELIKCANTGADAIRRAPIVNYNSGIKCVRVGDLSQGRDYSDWGYCEVSITDHEKFRLRKNNIVVTRTGTIGLNILIMEDLEAVYNNGLIRVILKDNIEPFYTYQLINSKEYFDHINKITGETSTRPNMKVNYLLNFRFSKPNDIIIQKYSSIIESLLTKIETNNKEINKIVKLRDTLLPKLMSGEIRVPLDIEEQ